VTDTAVHSFLKASLFFTKDVRTLRNLYPEAGVR